MAKFQLPDPYVSEGEWPSVQRNFEQIKLFLDETVEQFDKRVDDLETDAVIAVDTRLRVAYGIVDTTSPGSVVEGTGFTVTRNGVGDVTITFTTAFSDVPAVALGSVGNTASLGATPTTTTAQILRYVSTTGAQADGRVTFVASGPA